VRQQVDQFKREAAEQPTNPQNVAQRALLLWQWLNAYALSGGPIPVNATQELAAGFVLNDARQQGTQPAIPVNVRNLVSNVDALIYELRIKDEHPKALPTIRADKTGPFDASSFQTSEQIITIGEKPMNPGGGITRVDERCRASTERGAGSAQLCQFALLESKCTLREDRSSLDGHARGISRNGLERISARRRTLEAGPHHHPHVR